MSVQTWHAVQRVGHLGSPGVGRDHPDVADLATGLRVEGRAVEDDAHLVARIVEHREHACLALVFVATGELGRPELFDELRVALAVVAHALALARFLGASLLLGHLGGEAVVVDLDSTLRGDLSGELERESVRVVQQERHRAGQAPRRSAASRARR